MPNKRGSKLKTADEGVARMSVTESGLFLVRESYLGNADFAARILNFQTVIGTIFLHAIRARHHRSHDADDELNLAWPVPSTGSPPSVHRMTI